MLFAPHVMFFQGRKKLGHSTQLNHPNGRGPFPFRYTIWWIRNTIVQCLSESFSELPSTISPLQFKQDANVRGIRDSRSCDSRTMVCCFQVIPWCCDRQFSFPQSSFRRGTCCKCSKKSFKMMMVIVTPTRHYKKKSKPPAVRFLSRPNGAPGQPNSDDGHVGGFDLRSF